MWTRRSEAEHRAGERRESRVWSVVTRHCTVRLVFAHPQAIQLEGHPAKVPARTKHGEIKVTTKQTKYEMYSINLMFNKVT